MQASTYHTGSTDEKRDIKVGDEVEVTEHFEKPHLILNVGIVMQVEEIESIFRSWLMRMKPVYWIDLSMRNWPRIWTPDMTLGMGLRERVIGKM